jgi:ABC-type sugar transport system ATPase subunit
MNFVPAQVETREDAAFVVLPGGATLEVPPKRAGGLAGRQKILLGIRPEHMHRQRDTTVPEGYGQLPVAVEIVEPMGANTLINFRLGDTSMIVRLDGYSEEQPGDRLDLLVDMNRAVFIDPETERVV